MSSYFSSTHFRLRNHFFGTYEFSTNFVLQYYPPWVTEPFQNLRIFYEFRSPVLPTLGYGTIFPEPTNFPRNFVPQYYPPWVTEPFFGTYEFLNMPKISHTEYAYDFPYWICLRFPILNMPTISHTEYAYDFPYWICLRFIVIYRLTYDFPYWICLRFPILLVLKAVLGLGRSRVKF